MRRTNRKCDAAADKMQQKQKQKQHQRQRQQQQQFWHRIRGNNITACRYYYANEHWPMALRHTRRMSNVKYAQLRLPRPSIAVIVVVVDAVVVLVVGGGAAAAAAAVCPLADAAVYVWLRADSAL